MLIFAALTIILSLALATTQTRPRKPARAYVYTRHRR